MHKKSSYTTTNSSNPLLRTSQAPLGAPEFHLYSVEQYKEAFEIGIAEKRAEIEKIVENREAPPLPTRLMR